MDAHEFICSILLGSGKVVPNVDLCPAQSLSLQFAATASAYTTSCPCSFSHSLCAQNCLLCLITHVDHAWLINGSTRTLSGPCGGLRLATCSRWFFQHLMSPIRHSLLTCRLVETATLTVPINVAPPLRDTHSSGHDADTQTRNLSLDAFTQSVPPSSFTQDASASVFTVPCFPAAASAPRSAPNRRTLVIARMAPHLFLREKRSVPPLMCSSRFTDLLGHPPTPGLAEHSQRPPSHLIPSKAHAPTSDAQCQCRPGREHRMRPIILPLRCLMQVPSRWDNIYLLPPAAGDQGLSVPPWREHNPSSATLLAPVTTNHSRSQCLRVCRWSGLPSPNPAGRAPFSTRTATSCITCTASLCSSGIRAQHANTPHKIWRRPAEDAMRSSCKKPVIMLHESRTSSLRTRAARTLPISLNKDTFEPDAAVFAISKASPSKDTRKMAALVVRGLLRRPFKLSHGHVLLSPCPQRCGPKATPRFLFFDAFTLTWCSTKVDFIGGDFNMSAFSTAGDVFADPELAALGNSLLWGLCGLDDSCREYTGFIIMHWRPCEWRVDADGCYKYDNAQLGFGPLEQSAHFPVYLHLRTTILPGPDSITRSAQAQQRRMDRAAGQYERKRLRKHLALQPTSHPSASRT